MTSALARLRHRRDIVESPLCLGIDPHPDTLPDHLPRTAQGVERFARGILEAAVDEVVAVKVNAAFFEAFGADGWRALERVRRAVPPEVVCVVDAKRGDIGTTAERYAEAIFGHLDADGVTLSPYLGEDAIEPFRDHPGRLIYVLARTSNPSAGRLQSLAVGDEPLHLRVARWVADRWTDGSVGLVVGATEPTELRTIRAAVPGPAFLVPGVGAQGGDLAAAVDGCDGAWAPGLVSVSRGIGGASAGPDWAAAAATAARDLRGRMRDAVLHSNDAADAQPPMEH